MRFFHFYAARADTGAVLPNALVSVFNTGTSTLAALFDQVGATLVNPTGADANGGVGFSIADGVYDILIAGFQYTAPLQRGVQIYDLPNLTNYVATLAAGFLTYDTLAHLNADLAHGPLQGAQVVSDGTNNGIYQKQGASGAGSWLKISGTSLDAVSAQAAAAVAALAAAVTPQPGSGFGPIFPDGTVPWEIGFELINHPDMNTVRANALLGLLASNLIQGGVGSGFGPLAGDGTALWEITASLINHPDANSMRGNALLGAFAAALIGFRPGGGFGPVNGDGTAPWEIVPGLGLVMPGVAGPADNQEAIAALASRCDALENVAHGVRGYQAVVPDGFAPRYNHILQLGESRAVGIQLPLTPPVAITTSPVTGMVMFSGAGPCRRRGFRLDLCAPRRAGDRLVGQHAIRRDGHRLHRAKHHGDGRRGAPGGRRLG